MIPDKIGVLLVEDHALVLAIIMEGFRARTAS